MKYQISPCGRPHLNIDMYRLFRQAFVTKVALGETDIVEVCMPRTAFCGGLRAGRQAGRQAGSEVK